MKHNDPTEQNTLSQGSQVAERSPRKLDIEMSEESFTLLKQAMVDKTTNVFIEEYKKEHQLPTTDDVITLALMKMIDEHDTFMVRDLLYAKELKTTGLEPKYDLIVTSNKDGENPIIHALKNGSCVQRLLSFIYGLKLEDKDKFVIDEDLVQKYKEVIKNPPDEIHPQSIIDEFIAPLYTEEATRNLVKVVGQGFLDSYYV